MGKGRDRGQVFPENEREKVREKWRGSAER